MGYLSLPKQFPLLYLFRLPLFSSLQYLTSTLIQGGEAGHLFRLTCSTVLQGGRNTANKYHWCVWGVLGVLATLGLPPLTASVLSWATILMLQAALQGNCLKWALGCMHFPGLSHSGSGSQVPHKGTDSVGPAFCALPRSEQLRWSGAWQAHSPWVGRCVLSPPWSWMLFLGAQWECCLRCAMCLFWGTDLWLWPSWWISTVQDPRKTWLATGSLLAVW